MAKKLSKDQRGAMYYMKNQIKNILNEINPYVEISDNTDLLEEVIDSLAMILLINEIESTFNINIPLEEIMIEDFQTLDSIVKLISRFYKI